MDIPANLRWLRDDPEGRPWLDGLERRVAELATAWDLELGEPFTEAFVSYACPARRADGTDAVLKVQFPHHDCRTEAAALAAWDGRGAVRLLAHDADRWALLIERARPGTLLRDGRLGDDGVLDVMAALTEQTWIEPGDGHRFSRLQDEAHQWCRAIDAVRHQPDRPGGEALLDAAIGCLRDVADDQGPQVIVNQDLHQENVLAAEREPWLVIDPKPLVGERELAAAPMARSIGHHRGAAAAVVALDRLCERLELDQGRATRWMVGQTVCWALHSSTRGAAMSFELAGLLVERLAATR